MCNSEYCHPNTCWLKCLLVCHTLSWDIRPHYSMSGHCHHGTAATYVCTVCTLYTLLVLDSLMYSIIVCALLLYVYVY